MLTLKVKTLREGAKLPEHVGGNNKSCWMDLYVSRVEVVPEYGQSIIANTKGSSVSYHAGDIVKIGFGVAMEMPEGYEGWLVPRSSTEKNFGLILTNSHGVIDEAYRGDTDEWQGRFLSVRPGTVCIGDRLAQFRLHEKMPDIKIVKVDKLYNESRGGYGTSGK